MPWQQRVLDLWQELRGLPRSRHLWYAAGFVILVVAACLFVWKVGVDHLLFYGLVILFAYRFVRNRPQHAQAKLARRLSKIPEVRLIVIKQQHVEVVVERSSSQLYLRINEYLRNSNRILLYGPAMTLSILNDTPSAQLQAMLSGPGVQYVRPDLLEKKS